MKTSNSFRHESLQDAGSIKDLLDAITKGIGKGKITLEDENGRMVMEPEGLLHLKVSASEEDATHKLSLRISWHGERDVPKDKSLKIGK